MLVRISPPTRKFSYSRYSYCVYFEDRLKESVRKHVILFVFYRLKEQGISFEKMFEEIPVVVKNSHLINCLLCEVEEEDETANKFQHLDLATGSVSAKMFPRSAHFILNKLNAITFEVRNIWKLEMAPNREQAPTLKQIPPNTKQCRL